MLVFPLDHAKIGAIKGNEELQLGTAIWANRAWHRVCITSAPWSSTQQHFIPWRPPTSLDMREQCVSVHIPLQYAWRNYSLHIQSSYKNKYIPWIPSILRYIKSCCEAFGGLSHPKWYGKLEENVVMVVRDIAQDGNEVMMKSFSSLRWDKVGSSGKDLAFKTHIPQNDICSKLNTGYKECAKGRPAIWSMMF